jgi:hypothetical protein
MAATLDLLIFQGGSQQSLLRSLPINGLIKLAQRWLMEFSTEQGSIPYEPGRGCPFFAVARQGGLRTELDVFQAFAMSGSKVRLNLQSEEDPVKDPPNERFAGANLLQVVISGALAALRVQIVSKAGTAGILLVPIQLSA